MNRRRYEIRAESFQFNFDKHQPAKRNLLFVLFGATMLPVFPPPIEQHLLSNIYQHPFSTPQIA
jgi:hypothetical protein